MSEEIKKHHPNHGWVTFVEDLDENYCAVRLASGEIRSVTKGWLTAEAPLPPAKRSFTPGEFAPDQAVPTTVLPVEHPAPSAPAPAMEAPPAFVPVIEPAPVEPIAPAPADAIQPKS